MYLLIFNKSRLCYVAQTWLWRLRTITLDGWRLKWLVYLSQQYSKPLRLKTNGPNRFGTTSIYFINTLHHLSGVDNIPTIDGWSLSTLASKEILCHELSQLSSTTWLDGKCKFYPHHPLWFSNIISTGVYVISKNSDILFPCSLGCGFGPDLEVS